MDEMQAFVLDEYDVECSPDVIYSTLREAGWSRKVVTKHAKERSQLLRDLFYLRSRSWRIDQIVALDESAANERSCDRKRGWSVKGESCIASYSAKRSER